MFPLPQLCDADELASPAAILFRDVLEQNVERMIQIARGVSRLRPHCKTHKMAALIRRLLALGIDKHKCATLAEAEMLAQSGVRDVLLAYNIVGPNISRVVRFLQRYPEVRLTVTADDPQALRQLQEAVCFWQRSCPTLQLGVMLDLDPGLQRTGVSELHRAAQLYQQIVSSPAFRAAGLHWYDGHCHQSDRDERRQAVLAGWERVASLRDAFVRRGWPVPTIVCGGTASFPIYAELDDPVIELAPGTCVFHDANYARKFPDLPFEPALWLLSRVVSRPGTDRLTCDLGYKAVAADSPREQRVCFPQLPDAVAVLHNEEHLVLQTALADQFHPGDVLWAVPGHVCPTTVLYPAVHLVEQGRIVDCWDVTARDRSLTL